MCSRTNQLIVAAVILAVLRANLDPAGARIVRDDKGPPANPAIQTGGLQLLTGPAPQIPYSLIGAIASDNRWVGGCNIWSWRLFDAFSLQRFGTRTRIFVKPFGDAPFNRFPPSAK